jgi:hypothetical protein
VTELDQFSRPVVRTGASFHADQTRFELRKEHQQLRALQCFLQRTPIAITNAVHNEHILGQINTHAHNRFHGSPR